MKMNRRQFLQTSGALFCAPAIVKAENLMKIWVPPEKKIVVDVFESDFGTLHLMKRKPLQRRTAEEAMLAALEDAWQRGGNPNMMVMSEETLRFFRRSKFA